MPDDWTTALVVGKFAPLHKGHMLVLETAKHAADELVVAVYEMPQYAPSAETRAGWVRALVPDATVIVLADPDPQGDPAAISRAYADHFRQHHRGRITHVFTSEEYGDRFACRLGAVHVPVDPERRRVPISATVIRSDPARYREFLDPLVYRSLVTKVCFVGAESTGKTTLAAAMADRYGTAWMPEYGRELWELKGRRLATEDFVTIAEEHLRREQELLLRADRFLFCDTNALATEFWSRFYCGRCEPELVRIADTVANDYAYVLCSNDFGWVQDGSRETEGTALWHEHQRSIRENLMRRGLAYFEACGTVVERVDAVSAWLEETFPRGPIAS